MKLDRIREINQDYFEAVKRVRARHRKSVRKEDDILAIAQLKKELEDNLEVLKVMRNLELDVATGKAIRIDIPLE